jgi:hypothetical protein
VRPKMETVRLIRNVGGQSLPIYTPTCGSAVPLPFEPSKVAERVRTKARDDSAPEPPTNQSIRSQRPFASSRRSRITSSEGQAACTIGKQTARLGTESGACGQNGAPEAPCSLPRMRQEIPSCFSLEDPSRNQEPITWRIPRVPML